MDHSVESAFCPATHEWILNCSNPNRLPDLWLRDGDVIEVPEK